MVTPPINVWGQGSLTHPAHHIVSPALCGFGRAHHRLRPCSGFQRLIRGSFCSFCRSYSTRSRDLGSVGGRIDSSHVGTASGEYRERECGRMAPFHAPSVAGPAKKDKSQAEGCAALLHRAHCGFKPVSASAAD